MSIIGETLMPSWVLPTLTFMLLLFMTYLLYRISRCLENVGDFVSKVIDNVSDVAEPAMAGIGTVISAVIAVATSFE